MRPSVHPSPLPFTFDSAVYAQGGVGARGLFGDTKQRPIHSNPAHRLQQKNHPTSSACGSALLQSLSLNPLSFCVAVIYSNAISLSSSSSLYSSLRFSNPPHHPPIIFPSPKLTEPPKAIRSDCLISRHRVRRLKWKMRIPLSHYFYSVFILSFIRLSSVSHFFPHLSFTLSIRPPPHIHILLSVGYFTHASSPFVAFPGPANLTPFLFSFPFISALRPLLGLTGSFTGMGIRSRDQRVRL